ncbi:ABC transporter permease [Candidatus Allofournierella excrementigallinarum]|uniref:ABC transporter permease n=1 Tax=Candidatus Allofournierella excrementigallinarum TaxID=2838592 RepID=UPI00374F1183
MRRALTALAALALALLTAAGMKNADALAANCQSVSLRWRRPIAAETAEAAREKQPGLTFWREETASLGSLWRQAEAAVLYYRGNASLVWGAECLSGSMPSPLDAGGCAVSTALAWQLFGSEDAVGLTLFQETAEYTVRGVFESEEPVALLPKADAAFTAAELPLEEGAGGDPAARVDACLVKSGLPEPGWRLYTPLPAALARGLAWLPLAFGAAVLAAALVRRAARLSFPARDAAFFALLGAAALALPAFLSAWPSWLTPTRWSDFSWWGQAAGQLSEMGKAFLTAPCAGRDLAIKTGLLAQGGLALLQCALCEALRCRFAAAEMRLPRTVAPAQAVCYNETDEEAAC